MWQLLELYECTWRYLNILYAGKIKTLKVSLSLFLSPNIAYYPILGADSRFWLANNREVYTRISRLTSSAWNIMRKECHCDAIKQHCIYDGLGQIKRVSEILKTRKRFRIWHTTFEHGINWLHLVCFRGNGNLSILSIAIPHHQQIPHRVSKQGVTNNITFHSIGINHDRITFERRITHSS